LREGRYLLRTNLVEEDPAKLWSHYLLLGAVTSSARISGLRTAPLPARSSPASQHSGDGRLPGKKIALDLQLPDLAV
jgi:hypothetical protein